MCLSKKNENLQGCTAPYGEKSHKCADERHGCIVIMTTPGDAGDVKFGIFAVLVFRVI